MVDAPGKDDEEHDESTKIFIRGFPWSIVEDLSNGDDATDDPLKRARDSFIRDLELESQISELAKRRK